MSGAVLQFSPDDIAWLKSRDPELGEFMEVAGPVRRECHPDPFQGLIHAIAGQQVSAAAHRAVWNRLLAAYPNPDPGTLARANPEELRECGLSRNKAVYIIGAAVRFASGEFANLERLSDEEIIAKIVSLRGAGIWTAEMTLIFTFRRRDVVSRADFGIRKGMRTVYGLEELTAEEFAKRAKNYSPLGSLASLYLWEAASGRYPGFADPAAKKVK